MANENEIEFTVRVKNAGLGELANDVAKVEDSTKELGSAATAAGTGLDKLGDAAGQAGGGLDQLAAAEDKAQANSAELGSSAATTAQEVDGVGQAAAQAGGGLQQLAAAEGQARQQAADLGAGSSAAGQAVAELGADAQQAQGGIGRLTTAEAQAEAQAHALGTGSQAASKGLADVGQASDKAGSELAELATSVDAKTRAIKAGLQVDQSEIELQRQHLVLAREEQQGRLQTAQALGDQAAAIQAQNRLRQIESDQLALTARGLRAEATAVAQVAQARREQLSALGPLTQAQSQELQAADNTARALRVQSAATDQAAQRARELGAASETAAAGQVKMGNELAQATQMLTRFAAGLGVVLSVKEVGQIADQFNNLQSRIKLVTGEGDNFTRSWQGVTEVALRTHSALEDTGVLFTRLAQAGKDAGLSTAQASAQSLALTETINQAIQLSGAGAQASSAAITQLVQGLQGGALRGDEFNSVMEQSPRLARALADGLGVTTGELRKMAEAGLLTSDTVIKALKGQSQTVAGEFAKLPPTVGRALQDLSTQWTLYVGETDKATGSSALAAKGIEALANNLRTVAGLLIDAGQAVAAFTALRLAQHFLGIGAAAQGAATATTGSTAATAANTAATVQNTVAIVANAATKVANTAATSANATANAAAASSANRFAGAFSGLGAQVRAASGAVSAGTGVLGRFAGMLGGLPTFVLVAIAANFKDIGTWIGESAAKLAGYKDRTEELVRAEKLQADIAKEAAADRERLAVSIQAAIDRTFDLSKAARASVAEFEQLTKEGNSTAEALKKATDSFDLTKVQGIRDFSAVLEKLSADGKITATELQAAWAQALNGKDLADFEVKARLAFGAAQAEAEKAAVAVQAAIARGVSGDEFTALKAKSEAAFAVLTRESSRAAQLMDSLLREAVRRTGLEFDQLQGKIGAASRSAINDVEAIVNGLDSLKAQGVDTGRVLVASLSKAIETTDGQAAIDNLRGRIEQLRKVLGDKITDGLLDQAREKANELKDAMDKATPAINSVREAMKQLGITSDESLKKTATNAKDAYDTLTASGTASARELGEGFKKAAEAAIAANKGIAPAWVEGQAAVRGFEVVIDSAGKSTLKLRDSLADVANSSNRAAGSMVKDWTGVGSSINVASRALQEYQQRMAEKYGRPGEGDKGLFESGRRSTRGEELSPGVQEVGTGGYQFRNKDGMTSDAKGNVQQQWVWTRAAIIDYLKQAGMDELLAERLAAQFVQPDGSVPYVASEAQKKWGGPSSTLAEALGKMVDYYQYGNGKSEANTMLEYERNKNKTPSTSPSPAPSPTPSPAPAPGTGGATYVNNITINGAGDWGVVRGTTRHVDAQSAQTEIDLLRDLAQAKGAAI
ncbi:tape measure protein [Acidovorax sp. SUPP3334]|uniref:tape measure protein n=1 Tax=Acidovorax sp. SUPP3334 TaxID=2920881 RepID=UPI0023DE64BF|nr:tape measure protein [Acidovorax sp. SUPP3334]GKT22525.1 tape measure protein [Acidovorax sp. SUPP3334]